MFTRISLQENPAQVSSKSTDVAKGRQAMDQFSSLSPAFELESASSSSLSNTDSDYSLRSSKSAASASPKATTKQPVPQQTSSNNSKSPILIKYNYYDHNGARQEQSNHDMNYQAGHQQPGNRVQRHLSPTFRHNLDQIVSQQQQRGLHQPTSPPSSPEQQLNNLNLIRRYKLSSYEQRCLRCNKTVYQMDKVGPLKDFTFYHQNCFKCRECGTKLTLKTYFNNQQSSGDQEVYCHRHCPKTGPGKLDNQSVGIRAALNAPKVFDLLNNQLMHHSQAIMVDTAYDQLGPGQQLVLSPNSGYVKLTATQLEEEKFTKLQNIYKQSQVDKKISQFLNKRLEFLEPKQKMLEMRHREEEDALFKAFEQKWRQEEKSVSEQIKEEWQVELAKLMDKYKRQLDELSSRAQPSQAAAAAAALAAQLAADKRLKMHNGQQQQQQTAAANELSKQQMIEFERMNLEKTMTIKLDRKKETLKRKLKEFERQAMAELVEKQSREMLALISMKLDEYKEEQKRKIGSDLEQFEAIESLANQLGSSLQLQDLHNGHQQQQLGSSAKQAPAAATATPSRKSDGQPAGFVPPAPKPPLVSKMDLYKGDEPDLVFREVDQLAINVAREDQQTFTDLVHHLTRYCLTDIEKVRAIFRWITVKNLNTMHFDSSVKPDTPLGLLRGIKNGSESYHVLFKRLCSYAGLHCVVIKGFSKSAGYQPGVKFEGNRFRNSWNAVFVANSWRFVQCNWGARHLVSVAMMQDKNQPAKANGRSATSGGSPTALLSSPKTNCQPQAVPASVHGAGRSQQLPQQQPLRVSPNHGRRGLVNSSDNNNNNHQQHYSQLEANKRLGSQQQPLVSPNSISGSQRRHLHHQHHQHQHHHHRHSPPSASSSRAHSKVSSPASSPSNDSLRYEYDDHYFLTDPDEFIYEFFPLASEWQLIKQRPISLAEFEQLPFVRSLFFKYGLYFPQANIKSVLQADSSGATTIKIGMPTHMIPSLIFHYNLKYFDNDLEHYDGICLKRFVMQSVESGTNSTADNNNQLASSNGSNHSNVLLANIVSFRVHLPENGSYILDIFANSTTPTQYITGEPMKFKSVCKFKIIAKNLKTVMIPLPDCASGEYGPLKATRLFGLIPITHESGLITVASNQVLEIQFRMTRPLLDFMASLHKNNHDERQLSKSIKIFIDGDIVSITVSHLEEGQYGLDIYTRDQALSKLQHSSTGSNYQNSTEPKKQLLTHCCKYLINVRGKP